MRSFFLVLPLVALLAACASSSDSPQSANGRDGGRSRIPEAVVTGAPENCVQINRIRNSRVHGDQVIDFHMIDGTVYRNTLPNSCPQLGFEESFTYSTSQSQLCSVDIITVLVKGGGVQRGASCGLGQFQPVKLAKK